MVRTATDAHNVPSRWTLVAWAFLLGILLGSPATSPAEAQDQPAEGQDSQGDQADDEMASRYRALSKLLSGSTLQGHFTVDGQTEGLKEEEYQIQSVTKLPAGDLWLFKVRIRYGDHDVNVPLPLNVSWAGKTPMIVVDQLPIPGLGTFDARVVLADRRYAGTWQHGDVGGHLFGKIVPAPEPAADKPEAAEAEAEADQASASPFEPRQD